MEPATNPKPNQTQQPLKLKLYVYGSRQADQYFHPAGRTQSRRPICLSTLPEFKIEDEKDKNQEQAQGKQKSQKIYPNPFFTEKIYKIACGGLHTIVLTSTGSVYTFGCNDEGALGRKGQQCIPMKVDLKDPCDLIAAGDNHSLFANSVNGAVYFTGNYNFLRGQKITQSVFEPIQFFTSEIDIRNKNKPIQKIVSGANHSIIMVDNKIFCRGQPEAYTIGRRINERRKNTQSLIFDGVGLSHVVNVWCGGYHSIAKIKHKQVFQYWGWGSNSRGQLGINNYDPQPYPVELKKLRGQNIIQMHGGTFFSVFLNKQGQVFACGSNQNGNIGIGSDLPEKQEDSEKAESDEENQQKIENKLVEEAEKKLDIKEDQSNKMNNEEKLQQQNIYIKTIQKIKIPQPITNLACGSDFTHAWNKSSLYTWGFGMNYVLLNGQEEDQTTPFKVNSKIINHQIIYDVASGGQHVAYLAYENIQKKQINVELDAKVYDRLSLSRAKPSRRK